MSDSVKPKEKPPCNALLVNGREVMSATVACASVSL